MKIYNFDAECWKEMDYGNKYFDWLREQSGTPDYDSVENVPDGIIDPDGYLYLYYRIGDISKNGKEGLCYDFDPDEDNDEIEYLNVTMLSCPVVPSYTPGNKRNTTACNSPHTAE